MSFFGRLFRTERAESLALIDISADSVGGAYVICAPGARPRVISALRLSLDTRRNEPHESAMLRTLAGLGDALVRAGAPALLRATGSGAVREALVSVGAPWGMTAVRIERFEDKTPFTFTRKLVGRAMKKAGRTVFGMALVDESVVGTILNGYETRSPYGKQARRADVVIMASFVRRVVAERLSTALRGFFPAERIAFIAGNSARYQAVRSAFPHERDALILDVSEARIALTLVRQGLIVAVSETSGTGEGGSAWLGEVRRAFAGFAERYPLPRAMFLIARESDAGTLARTLAAADMSPLWLSDNPPVVVPVLARHLAALVEQSSGDAPDLALSSLALYAARRDRESGAP